MDLQGICVPALSERFQPSQNCPNLIRYLQAKLELTSPYQNIKNPWQRSGRQVTLAACLDKILHLTHSQIYVQEHTNTLNSMPPSFILCWYTRSSRVCLSIRVSHNCCMQIVEVLKLLPPPPSSTMLHNLHTQQQTLLNHPPSSSTNSAACIHDCTLCTECGVTFLAPVQLMKTNYISQLVAMFFLYYNKQATSMVRVDTAK